MTYHVTELDIRRGKRFEPGDCPAALAIKRRHPHAGVLVTSVFAIIGQEEHELPGRVKRFVHDFDGGRPVNPIRFEL